jgi:hypothetical protein
VGVAVAVGLGYYHSVYVGDTTEYGYEKNKAYGLKLTQDDQFPTVVTSSKRTLYRRRRNQTQTCLFYSEQHARSLGRD